ncbi:MAG TPA: metalloregulator ArsR/SmtB family transcription factor [Anaeromyxobacter sp.]
MDARETTAVRVARALGDPTRFRMLRAIAGEDELSCRALTERFRLAQATVSHHLKVLTEAGLVSARKQGPFHYYRLRRDALAAHGATIARAFGGGAAARRARRPGRAA